MAGVAHRRIVAAMVAVGISQSIGFTAAYPLAADGAERAGVGQGVAMGLLSVSWGLGALVGPCRDGCMDVTNRRTRPTGLDGAGLTISTLIPWLASSISHKGRLVKPFR